MTADSLSISIRQVTKKFGGITALDDVSFDVEPGGLHAIVGENGAGKSTLMKILAGALPDYDGRIAINGRDIRFEHTLDAEAAGIGIIYQELNLVEQLSAAANIFLGRERRNRLGLLDQRTMESEATRWLSQLECQVPPGQLVGRLRVGDQQLVEIAKALSKQARILIMDEPTSALTEGEVERLLRVIDKLRADGVTILYISHKMKEVFALATRITVLRDGRHVATLDREQTTPEEITKLMVGRELSESASRKPNPLDGVTLEVRNLSLPWPGHARGWRLKNVSFQLRRGEILGIAGLMGAGRTELLECLFGASREDYLGQILLDGAPARFRHPRDAYRAGLAMVTEDRKRLGLFSQFSVERNISLSSLERAKRAGLLSRSKERRLAQSSVDALGVKSASLSAPVLSLSGGNQQKAILGRWLLTNPRVLLLDDPTRGVDVGAKAEIYRVMERLANEGMAILVTSSELPELLTVCDRILVLCEGNLTGEFPRNEATEEKIMRAATAVSTSL